MVIFILALCCCPLGISATSPNPTSSPSVGAASLDSTDSQKQLLYRDFLNMETPAGVSDFSGDGVILSSPSTFLSSGYFAYTADTAYFEQLEAHDRFIVDSEFNRRIHETPCDRLPLGDFSYWEDVGFSGEISLEDKVCFQGTFVPFVHYIVYDPSTQQVHHFIEGMRE
jgi:hypothetical protein